MAEQYPEVAEVVQKAKELFQEEYDCPPTACGIAPGRVNLIGEHTDYNDGLVLPMALPMVTVVVGKMSDSGRCKIITSSPGSGETNKVEECPTDIIPGPVKWANYVKGTMANFHDKDAFRSGFEAAIVTSVPMGGGLSSSAALEVSFYTFLEGVTSNFAQNKKDKALACQTAENVFAGLPCGIMDQFVSIFGEAGHAVLIDCRSLEAKTVTMDDPSVAVLITNSNVKHELTGSEYSERRAKCYEAAALLGVKTLRESKVEDIEAKKSLFVDDEVMYRRFRHVVSEIDRTLRGADALTKREYSLFGKLMIESHNSLRDDFEVSCPELDQLVEAALEVDGVFGSRMTGGGFGGCTVTLLKKEAVPKAIETMKAKYTLGNPTFFVCEPSEGCRTQAIN